MKLSYNWLKEYVDLDVSPEEVARGLTMSGSEVGEIHDFNGDSVMELEITSNRPDCLNIIGLAREAATTFDKDLRLPEISAFEGITKEGRSIECVIENTGLCPRYTARVIENVRVKGSEQYFKHLLEAVGLRPVNNIVDITNFCLMEMGQPLHAFDLDKIRGNKIIVREAVKGEKILTIDGVERELEPGMLVIADSERPIAIAGIMGGQDTEVSDTTKNVLLESAYFDPISVRQTARKLGLSSESSYRFERGVDKGMIAMASDRAAGLINREAGGKTGGFYDVGNLAAETPTVEFDIERAGRILGVLLREDEVKRIFKRLGVSVEEERGKTLKTRIPTFREDLKREIDLVEEVARIYEYDKIPVTMERMVPQVRRKEHPRQVTEKIREILPSLGLNEIITYSLISGKAVDRFGAIAREAVQLVNPLSEEQRFMATQLLDGMLKTISWNINRKNGDLALFEVGKIYTRPGEGDKFSETPALCIALSGALRKNWQEGERPAGFYDMKGILENMFEKLKLKPVFYEKRVEGLTSCAGIKLSGEDRDTGFAGEAGKKLLKEYDITQPVYICQLELDVVIEKTDLQNRYHAIPRFPSSARDVSILCDESLAAGEIDKVITEQGEEMIRGMELLDMYKGEKIPAGKKNLTYSIQYGLDTRTLTDEEVEGVHASIKDALAERLGVTFR